MFEEVFRTLYQGLDKIENLPLEEAERLDKVATHELSRMPFYNLDFLEKALREARRTKKLRTLLFCLECKKKSRASSVLFLTPLYYDEYDYDPQWVEGDSIGWLCPKCEVFNVVSPSRCVMYLEGDERARADRRNAHYAMLRDLSRWGNHRRVTEVKAKRVYMGDILNE